MNGILNVRKEPGYTSFGVVSALRKILGEKKIGHTGTLDPAAEGVLPVCIGKATKLAGLITGNSKTYEAVLLLGVKTDTCDLEGEVLARHGVEVSKDGVSRCVSSFRGECEQVPPMYSAVKVNGKRLYELAREGKTIERKSRKVFFYDIEVLDFDLPEVKLRVKCSKGTYIRTLCDDIGDSLGCFGCMKSLVRTASGSFKIEDSLSLDEIKELAKNGGIDKVLIKPDELFKDLLPLWSNPCADRLLANGGSIGLSKIRNSATISRLNFEESETPELRMYDSNNRFIGIYRYSKESGMLHPVKMLV